MRFPFVSRFAFDLMCDGYERLTTANRQEIESLRTQLTDARREVYEAYQPRTHPEVCADVHPEPAGNIRRNGVAAAAIRQMAQGDTRLAEYLHKRKRELRREHPAMSDEGIVELLGQWESTEDEAQT